MIGTLEGILEYRGIDSVIVNVGGIGFQVRLPASTLGQLGAVGGKVSLYTHLHVTENNVSLYGFVSSAELALFKNLISVSGIGPQIALSLLSNFNPEQLAMGIASGNIELISQAPGVGEKKAKRIIVDLKTKIEREWSGVALPLSPQNTDVIAALTSLGYSLREATQAVSSLPSSGDLSLEERVKLALQQLEGT